MYLNLCRSALNNIIGVLFNNLTPVVDNIRSICADLQGNIRTAIQNTFIGHEFIVNTDCLCEWECLSISFAVT